MKIVATYWAGHSEAGFPGSLSGQFGATGFEAETEAHRGRRPLLLSSPLPDWD